MFGILFCLFILPYIYGSIFLREENKFLLKISVGILIELVIWTICSVFALFYNRNISTGIVVFVVCDFIFLAFFLKKVMSKNAFRKSIKYKKSIDEVKKHLKIVLFDLMLTIVLIQLIRLFVFQIGYGDNRVYTALVNDMVETDIYYPYAEGGGTPYKEINLIPSKYIQVSWYTYEAMLSKISGIKPLILIYTILPFFILIMMYIIWWELSDIFFKGNISERSAFIIIFALLTELRTEDVNDYILFWPTYGKNITASIVMPLFLLIWLYNCRERQRNYEVLLFLMMIAGCAASTMGLMMMPLEAGLLTGVEVIRNKKLERCMVYRFLLLMVPVLIYAYLFIR